MKVRSNLIESTVGNVWYIVNVKFSFSWCDSSVLTVLLGLGKKKTLGQGSEKFMFRPKKPASVTTNSWGLLNV